MDFLIVFWGFMEATVLGNRKNQGTVEGLPTLYTVILQKTNSLEHELCDVSHFPPCSHIWEKRLSWQYIYFKKCASNFQCQHPKPSLHFLCLSWQPGSARADCPSTNKLVFLYILNSHETKCYHVQNYLSCFKCSRVSIFKSIPFIWNQVPFKSSTGHPNPWRFSGGCSAIIFVRCSWSIGLKDSKLTLSMILRLWSKGVSCIQALLL